MSSPKNVGGTFRWKGAAVPRVVRWCPSYQSLFFPLTQSQLMPDWGFWLSRYYFYQYPVHLSFPSTNQTLLNTFTFLPDGKEEWLC